MINGFVGEIFKFIGMTGVGIGLVIPIMKICLHGSSSKLHKEKQIKTVNKKNKDKQWFYDVA